MKPYAVDFLSSSSLRRLQAFARGYRELLVRACGGKQVKGARIIDCTCGCAVDTLSLAVAGATVTSLERNPAVFASTSAALAQVRESPAAPPWLLEAVQRITLVPQDAISFLKQPALSTLVDVIYLDPMFIESKRSAKSNKELEAIRELVGEDLDGPVLLQAALAYGAPRVVVKRRDSADFLGELPPHHSIHGKIVRYDVYQSFSSASKSHCIP